MGGAPRRALIYLAGGFLRTHLQESNTAAAGGLRLPLLGGWRKAVTGCVRRIRVFLVFPE